MKIKKGEKERKSEKGKRKASFPPETFSPGMRSWSQGSLELILTMRDPVGKSSNTVVERKAQDRHEKWNALS